MELVKKGGSVKRKREKGRKLFSSSDGVETTQGNQHNPTYVQQTVHTKSPPMTKDLWYDCMASLGRALGLEKKEKG